MRAWVSAHVQGVEEVGAADPAPAGAADIATAREHQHQPAKEHHLRCIPVLLAGNVPFSVLFGLWNGLGHRLCNLAVGMSMSNHFCICKVHSAVMTTMHTICLARTAL